MDKDIQKKSTLRAQFNSLEANQNDPTILHGKVIVHDFEKSWNNQVITEEVCAENMHTLIGKRIVCKYIPQEDNSGVDALGSHEEGLSTDRETKEDIVVTETMAIGYINNVYIDDYTDELGITKRVLFAEITIWNDDKYANVVGLLQEWLNRGVKIHMSVEYLYCNYNVTGGVEYLQSPILYVAHTLLNSEQRNDCAEIMPAYDSATLLSLNEKQEWNKAINQLAKEINNKSENSANEPDLIINNNNNMGTKNEEEGIMAENKFYKALCELSLGDIKTKIMTALSKTMTAEDFQNIWISNYGIYDTYFVYENYENSKYVYYKVPYTKTESDVVVDLAQKVQVTREDVWVEVSQVAEVQTSLNTANERVAELETALNTKVEEITTKVTELEAKEVSINELNTKVETLTTEKEEVLGQFNEATEKITSLNSLVEELTPIKEKYETEQMEKALNEKKEFYQEKFKGVNALDKFEEEEVQGLIAESISVDKEIANKAIFSLNSMIINLVTPVEEEPVAGVKEMASSMNSLIPEEDDFEKKYGI